MEDSLGNYLDSLRKAKKYPVVFALPGHRKTGNYEERIEQLLLHHEKRLEEIIELLKEKPDMTLYELTGKMRWKIRANSWEEFPAAQKWFAVGECMAHVDHLEKFGKVSRYFEDGVWRYRAEV